MQSNATIEPGEVTIRQLSELHRGIRNYAVIQAHEDNRLAYTLLKLADDADHPALYQQGADWWRREITLVCENTRWSSGDREHIADLFELRAAIAASALIRDFPPLLVCELLGVPPEALDGLIQRGCQWADAQVETEAYWALVGRELEARSAREPQSPPTRRRRQGSTSK